MGSGPAHVEDGPSIKGSCCVCVAFLPDLVPALFLLRTSAAPPSCRHPHTWLVLALTESACVISTSNQDPIAKYSLWVFLVKTEVMAGTVCKTRPQCVAHVSCCQKPRLGPSFCDSLLEIRIFKVYRRG